MNFKEWLKLFEVGTATNSIAVFVRPIGASPLTGRQFPDEITMLGGRIVNEPKKKRRKHVNLPESKQ
jgi:hypothetical protein